jgi:hypothetical protein
VRGCAQKGQTGRVVRASNPSHKRMPIVVACHSVLGGGDPVTRALWLMLVVIQCGPILTSKMLPLDDDAIAVGNAPSAQGIGGVTKAQSFHKEPRQR